MSSVSAFNVVVTHDGFPALAQANFELPNQHFTIVTGPNGSGKTTLLKAIAGIRQIERGKLIITEDQNRYCTPRSLRTIVGYVGHNATYMRHIRVDEHFALVKKLDRKGHSSTRKYMIDENDACAEFDLQIRSNTRVENLSAGQQRRLNLASIFVRSTGLLCIDEPHSSLDIHWKDRIDSIFAKQFKLGRSFLIATHEPERFESIMTHHLELQSGVCRLVTGSKS